MRISRWGLSQRRGLILDRYHTSMTNILLNRRQAVLFAAASVVGARSYADRTPETASCTLGFGAYGLPDSTTEQAIDLVAAAGFDSIELYVLADRDLDAGKVPKLRRKHLRKRLADQGLKLTSLMENLRPLDSPERHNKDLKRLKAACYLARDLNPDDPPAVQTVLGGKNWSDVRELCAERLKGWAEVADATGVTVAIKPHRGNAMNRPEHAAWVLDQLGNPQRLRMWFDYSHYAFRDLPMDQMVTAALPITAGVAVKDAVRSGDRVTFDLPGKSGTIDYPKLLKLLYQGGYRGDICVEVSSAVWKRADYDPGAALEDCYQHLASAFEKAGVPRPQR